MITKMSTVTGIVWSISLSALIAGLALLLFSQSPRITLFSMFCLGMHIGWLALACPPLSRALSLSLCTNESHYAVRVQTPSRLTLKTKHLSRSLLFHGCSY